MIKLDRGLNKGQLREKKDLKRETSVRMRKPVPRSVAAPTVRIHRGRRTADDDGDDVFTCIEKEELGHDERLDQHDRAGSNDGEQSDDVEHSNHVQHDVTSAGQGPAKASHCEGASVEKTRYIGRDPVNVCQPEQMSVDGKVAD